MSPSEAYVHKILKEFNKNNIKTLKHLKISDIYNDKIVNSGYAKLSVCRRVLRYVADRLLARTLGFEVAIEQII